MSSTPSDSEVQDNMPPPRTHQATASITAPFSRVSFSTFIYVVTIGAGLLSVFYAWLQWRKYNVVV